MRSLSRVTSVDGSRYVDVLECRDGTIVLVKYIVRKDSEEGVEYVVRDLPDASGKFGDLGAALAEAERLVGRLENKM